MTMVQRQDRTDTGDAGMTGSEKSVIVSGLGKSFGDVQAVRGISFEVGRGEVVALLGPNGAGKTTTVDMLSTLTKPDRGTATIAGHDVASDPAAVRRSIMLTGQQVALDDVLTGRENLILFGRLQGLGKSAARSRAEELLTEFDLQYAAGRRVGTYSGGMRRRIDIACGLVVRPEVVFLDEPTTGLDPRSRQVIWDLVASFKNLGISTLLTSQYLEEADALSDRIIVIDQGEIVAEGTADELKERTGGSYCEIVPRDLNDLPAVVAALGPLLPEKNRAAALASESDRIAMPAPRGPNTLVEAVALLSAADIELTDIALRRPSLDDVFLALTSDNTGTATSNGSALKGPGSNGSALNGSRLAGDDQQPDIPIDTDDDAHPPGGRARSWVSAHARTLVLVVVCVIAVSAVSFLVLDKDSPSAGNDSGVPAVVHAPPSPAPSAPVPSLPAAPPAAAAPPPAAPIPTQAPVIAPPATRAQRPASVPVQTAAPTTQAPITSVAAPVSPPPVAVTSPAVAVSPSQIPTAMPAGTVSGPQAPLAAPPLPPGQPAPLPAAEVPPAPPPDPLQVVLSPLLGGLP
jgi:ABC-2 type transport system ATP-binding protein